MKKLLKRLIAVLMISLLATTMLVGCGDTKEKKANALYEAGEYEAAAAIFAELGDKKMQAQALYEAGGYEAAAEIFAELGDKKMQAESLYEAGKYGEAYEIFTEMNDLSGISKCLTKMRGILNQITPAG